MEKNKQQPAPDLMFLTRNQAANLLGVTAATLAKWDKTGILPALRLGKRIYYTPRHINLFLKY